MSGRATLLGRTSRFCLSLLAVGVVTPLPVFAAEQPVIEEIVVIGSRIAKPDYAYSNPVLSVDAQAIQQSGTTEIVSYLKQLPALIGSLDANDAAGSNAFIGGTGLSLLNLRNLGVERTLVLVDGRRHVAALPGTSAVDVDTIPIDLIERTEILTGGASAIYGADGVSGVVNFVMKDDFEGYSLRTQGGQSSEGDSDSVLLAFTAGKNFNDGASNVSFSVEYSHNDRLKGSDRDYATGSDSYSFVRNPFDPADDPAIADRIPMQNIRFFDSSRASAVDVDFDFVPDYNGDDSLWDPGLFVEPFFQQGGSGSRVDQYVGDLAPREERWTVNLFGHHEFSSHVNFFSELKYSHNESTSYSQPTFDFFLFVEPDYAFLPPNIAAAYADAALNVGSPALLASRDNFDLGVRAEDIERETLRSVIGIDGDLMDNLSYEVSYVYGKSQIDNDAVNNRLTDRYAAALDAVIDPATGTAVCRSNLDATAEPANLQWQGWNTFTPGAGSAWAGTFTPGAASGCVPINIMGDGAVSAAARNWIMATTTDHSELEQHVVQAFITGNSASWFNLPAGPLGFAAGVEYRKEDSSNEPADLDRGGFTFNNIIEPTKGHYDVKEAFVEIDIPLVSDVPGIEDLAFDAAYRFSDYSTIGNADSWKIGLVWRPIGDITFRGTSAQATRSPNIGELFDPGGQTFEFISDPCDINLVGNGSSDRAANCASLLTGLGVDPTTFIDPNSAGVGGLLRGNENLEEETADTYTLGVILNPRFIENLTISVDWYDIKLSNAINTAEPQTATDLCVDLPTLNNQFCSLIEREPGTGAIVDFTVQPVNVAEFRTKGYDFTVEYLLDPANIGGPKNIGTFDLRLIGNKLTELTFIELPGSDPNEDLGEEDAPEWQMMFNLIWQLEPFLVNYGISYFDETQRYTKQLRGNQPDIADGRYLDYEDRFVQDIYTQYTWKHGMSFFFGVNNFTDEKPDIGQVYYPVSAVGRFYFFGLNMSLDGF